MSDKKATLQIDGLTEAIELPIYQGTLGPDVVDVSNLTSQGMFTYDPGFVSTSRAARLEDGSFAGLNGYRAHVRLAWSCRHRGRQERGAM